MSWFAHIILPLVTLKCLHGQKLQTSESQRNAVNRILLAMKGAAKSILVTLGLGPLLAGARRPGAIGMVSQGAGLA